jgi:hypothetical protein
VAADNSFLEVFNSFGLKEIVGVEGVVAGPVGAGGGGLFCGWLGCLLFGGEVAGEHVSSKDRAGAFEELSFVHDMLSILGCAWLVERTPPDLVAGQTSYRDLKWTMQAIGEGKARSPRKRA